MSHNPTNHKSNIPNNTLVSNYSYTIPAANNPYKEAVLKSGVVHQFYKLRNKSISITSEDIIKTSEKSKICDLSLSSDIKQPEEESIYSFSTDTKLLIPVDPNKKSIFRINSLKGLDFFNSSQDSEQNKLPMSANYMSFLLMKYLLNHKMEFLIMLWFFTLGFLIGFLFYYLLD